VARRRRSWSTWSSWARAGPAHSLAPELLLKPVLVEMGATCPTKGLYLVDTSYDDPTAIEAWLTVARTQVQASLG
jgi:FMN reductase